MELTLEELKDRLISYYDPNEIVELLDLSSEDLIESFTDRVDDRYEYLLRELFTDVAE